MSRYQTYPEYKKTETDWLGDAPSHWTTIPVGRLFRRLKRTNQTEKELLSVYRDYGVIPKSSRDDNNNKPSEDLTPYQLVEQNDLVMNKMKTWQGSIAISEYEGIVSPAYFVYQPLKKLFELAYPKYVHYLLRNPMYIAQYLRRSKGIRVNQWDLDPGEFQRVELLLPTKNEQKKIFQFLDHETTKIDTLIEKQQQLIKLLKEKRQAVISHAVTKGLNPNAPMRDSGIEWLGKVPEHWEEVTRIKYISSLKGRQGWQGLKAEEYIDEGPYVVSSAHFTNHKIQWDTCPHVSPLRYARDTNIQLAKDDLLLMKDGAAMGKLAYVDDLPDKACLNSHLLLFRPMFKNEQMIYNPRFMYYFMQTEFFQEHIKIYGTGVTFLGISQQAIGNYRLVFPSINEQKEIIAYLEKETKKFDELEEKKRNMMVLLQERRTALISAAVTGKIDVRKWQPPEPSNNKLNNKEVAA